MKNDFMHILWQYETLKTEHRLTSASSTVMFSYDKKKPHKLLSSKGLRLWNTHAIFRSNRATLNGIKWTIALTTNGFANIKNVSALLCFAYFCFYESFESSFSFLLAILLLCLRGEREKTAHAHIQNDRSHCITQLLLMKSVDFPSPSIKLNGLAIAKTKSLTRFLISSARQRFTFYLKINTNPIPKQFNYICWPRKGHCCIHTVSDCDCHRNNKWISETRLIAVLFYHSAFLCIWTLKLCGLTHWVHHFTSLSRMNAV